MTNYDGQGKSQQEETRDSLAALVWAVAWALVSLLVLGYWLAGWIWG